MKGATPWLDSVPAATTATSGETGPERRRVQTFEARLDSLERPDGNELKPDGGAHREEHGNADERRRAGHDEPAEEHPDQTEALAAEQDPAEHDEMEGHGPAQPPGDLQPPAERVLHDQARAVERAPQHERSTPRRATGRPGPSSASGCGRSAAARRDCRRAGCRGSRAGSATASCASGARSRGTRSRGRGCGSSAGRRSPCSSASPIAMSV